MNRNHLKLTHLLENTSHLSPILINTQIRMLTKFGIFWRINKIQQRCGNLACAVTATQIGDMTNPRYQKRRMLSKV